VCDVILNVYVDMSVECPSEESNMNKSSFIMRPFIETDLTRQHTEANRRD